MCLILVSVPSFAQAPIAEATLLVNPSKQQLIAYTFAFAGANHVPAQEIIRTIECESQFNPLAHSPTDDWGLAQIHASAHPEIQRYRALDPYFSIRFIVSEFAKGNAREWVCARRLGY